MKFAPFLALALIAVPAGAQKTPTLEFAFEENVGLGTAVSPATRPAADG